MSELTKVHHALLERSSSLARSRMERAHPLLFSGDRGISRANSESIGTEIYISVDGEEEEYFKAGMVPGAAPLRPLNY